MGMEKFLKKYAKRKPDAKTAATSYSTHEEKATENNFESAKPKFIKDFSTKGEEFRFEFKNPDGTIAEVVKMRFDKEEHVYHRIVVNPETGVHEWAKVPGVTTILSIKDKSPALVPWAANETASYIKGAFLELHPEDLEEILRDELRLQDWLFKKADEAAKNFRKISQDATDVGKAAHDWLEEYVNATISQEDPSHFELLYEKRNGLDERAISCCGAALSWMRSHNVRWKFTERKIYSRRYNVAGTLDGCCLVDSCDDPDCCPREFKDALSIIDWKSSNALYETYRWQTAIYEDAVEEELGLDIKHRWVIQLGKYDGAFKKWHILEEDFDMDMRCFLACLELVKASEECVDTVRERKRAAKEKARDEREAKEAAEKAERLRIRTARKLAREERKVKYKEFRDEGYSVGWSTDLADKWLANEFAEIGGGDNVGDEVETEEKAA